MILIAKKRARGVHLKILGCGAPFGVLRCLFPLGNARQPQDRFSSTRKATDPPATRRHSSFHARRTEGGRTKGCPAAMATAALSAVRASIAAPSRADTARGRARLVRWRAATPRASPARPFAEPSSVRLGARGAGVGVARLHRLARRAVVDARHPPTSFDDRDGAAEGEMDDASANAGAARWDDEARRRKENAPADATADAETAETVDAIDTGAWPWWVDTLNRSLESYPAFVLLGFVLVDMGSALALLALITRFSVAADADFALAYALSKSVRAPRLALDAAVAAKLAHTFPALAAVRVGPILDAGVELGARLRARAEPLLRLSASARRAPRGGAATEPSETSETPGASPPREPRESRSRRAAREARAMTDAYGLAYMTAKNIIGPVSIALFYALLKYGVDVGGALAFLGAGVGAAGGATAAAGKTAGALALASWISTLFFPLVVLGAGFIGPKMGRAAERVARFARAR